MFRIHRHKSDRYREKYDFRFSNLSASQVPKGWDLLMISLISMETGKTVAKSSKAVVRNGSCQWSESFKETLWVSQDDALKDSAEGHLKIVISTGSVKSSVLGEVVLKLGGYINTDEASIISLPLKRCNFGTMLQLQVQGVIARPGFRDGLRKQLREFRSHNQSQMADVDGVDSRSDESDSMCDRSMGSSSSNLPVGGTYNEESGNREPSLSAPGSHHSSDSGESFVVRSNVSPKISISGQPSSAIGRQDSIGSQNSSGNGAGFGDETCRSNNSSFNSKASTFRWQDNQNSSSSVGVRHVDSSKELLEAAQETVEELRGEARMWEKTARKLKNDLEALKKEFSDQENHMGELDKEFSAACLERDKLKAELEQLKILSDASAVKQFSSDSPGSQVEDMLHKLKELEEEVKFQKDSNATLSRQLNKTQESNYELLSILQELEETIEKQRVEIANFSVPTPVSDAQRAFDDNSMELDSERLFESNAKEPNTLSSPPSFSELGSSPAADSDLVKEVASLREKVVELERDCAELTEENIELLCKLKEFKMDAAKTEVFSTRSHLFDCSGSHRDGVLTQGHAKEHRNEEIKDDLFVHCQKLEKKCIDLETELQFFKDKAHELGVKLQLIQLESEHKNAEIKAPQEPENYQQSRHISSDRVSVSKAETLDLNLTEISVLLGDIYEELQKPISHVKNPWFNNDTHLVTESETSIFSCATLKEKVDAILCDIYKLDKFLCEKMVECNALFMNLGTDSLARNIINQGQMEVPTDESNTGVDILFDCSNTTPAAADEHSQYGASGSCSVLKEEITALKQEKGKLENLICQLNFEKSKLEGHLEITLKEQGISSKSLDDLEQETVQLANNMEIQVSANNLLEKKLIEQESRNHDLEINLSELEEEKIHLSEHIADLEARLRYMTDEEQSNRLELETLRSLSINLKDEVSKVEAELEAQKTELKERLQEAINRNSEAQEESDLLKRTQSKLESTIESLIDESSSLQKSNGDLRSQKLDLQNKCALLEAELSKSYERFSRFVEKLDSLESNYAFLQKNTALEEESLYSQLESLCQVNKDQEEKLLKAHIILENIDTENMNEIESLRTKVALLTAQLSITVQETDTIGSDAVQDSSNDDKIKNENATQELLSDVQSYEKEIHNVKNDSGKKHQGMIEYPSASNQSEENLTTDLECMRKLMEDIKYKEEEVKKRANDLESKLKMSECEREQLQVDISNMKLQLQRIPQLQEQILSLQSSVDAAGFEKAKVEERMQFLSSECDRLSLEKKMHLEKISTMQKALSDSEDATISKLVLQEKLLQLESNLMERETSSSLEVELKNEEQSVKNTGSEHRQKVDCLEEKYDFSQKLQNLVEVSNFREDKRDQEESHSKKGSGSVCHADGTNMESRIQELEKELAEALQTNDIYRKELHDFQAAARERENPNDSENTPTEVGKDSRLSSLEAELKDLSERYTEMSLRYAEVEAEREELVLKMKSSRSQKRWF